MHEVNRSHPVQPGILHQVCDAEDLPSLPAVAVRVLQMTKSDDVSISDMAAVVGQDPVLTARILKLVNSPLFGVARKIVSLPQAMVVLGLRSVKVLTLSFSIVDSFGQKRVDWFDYKTYWRRSLTQAAAACLIAEQAAPHIRDEAFVAGLISNLGILAMAQVAPGCYVEPYRRAGGDHAALLEAEKVSLGLTHQDVGEALLSKWNLPSDICLAVALHHQGSNPDCDPRIADLVDTVSAAARIADLFCDGAAQARIDELHSMIADRLRIDRTRLDHILDTLHKHVRESANLMSVDIGQTASYQQIRDQAALELAKLSLAGEACLVAAQQREVANQQRQKELERAANTDALSGLANRAAFDRHIDQAVRRGIADGKAVGLILCDLDLFKEINDMYGHPVGDTVITATGKILAAYQSDDVLAARYGGEEFALVISNCAHDRLARLAQIICGEFRRASIACSSGKIPFSASVGAASTEGLSKPSTTALISLADKFLYLAKKRGRARACVAAPPSSAACSARKA